jgi:hypothetical protein
METLFALYQEEGALPERLEGAGGQEFLNRWLARLDVHDQQALRELALSERRDTDSERAIAQLRGQLRLASVERRFQALEHKIKESQKRHDTAAIQKLQKEQHELFTQRRQLLRQLGWGASAAAKGGARRDG